MSNKDNDQELEKVEIPILNDGEIEIRVLERHPPVPKKGWVGSILFGIFKLKEKDIKVGQISLRIGDSEKNFGLKFGGNIRILDIELMKNIDRGNRYAAKGCNLIFKIAKEVFEFSKVTITCSIDNIASKRTCEICGCDLVKTVEVDPKHDLFERGVKKIHIFKKQL